MLAHGYPLQDNTSYPLDKVLFYEILTDSHYIFLCNASTEFELSFFHQVVKIESWRKAMDEEIVGT